MLHALKTQLNGFCVIQYFTHRYGVSERTAMRILSRPDTGMTVTKPLLNMSVVFISRATSRGQWVDTVMHEIDHVQSAICDYYGVEPGSEDAAYLQGYLARLAEPVIERICPL